MDDCPEGQSLRDGWSRPVSRQATTRKSALFRAGAIVASPIRAITARRSLLPTSQAGLPIGSPYGALSLLGEIPGFHVPLPESAGLGACCRPGGVLATRAQKLRTLPPSSTFWFKRVNPLRLSYITIFKRRFRYLPHTSSLALTRCGVTRRGRLLHLSPRTAILCFVTLSGQLLIHAPRFTW